MKRRLLRLLGYALLFSILLTGCKDSGEQANSSSPPGAFLTSDSATETERERQPLMIHIITDTQRIVFQLNDSPAAQALYNQLPLTVPIENHSADEKIFYPQKSLDVSGTPAAKGPAGTLAYYAPWGNVAIFYEQCGGASGLYELGKAVSGAEQIAFLTGEIRIERETQHSGSALSGPDSEPGKNTVSRGGPIPKQGSKNTQEGTQIKLNIQVSGAVFSATLEENAAVNAFVEMLKEAPVSIRMSDYSGFEKVGPLGKSLPASGRKTTAQAGDIVLYQGNQIVIFYGSNSWSYTRLGKIDDLSGWKEALGSEDVVATFSIGQ